jgi:nucleotide-binding universal stress UspA family protein
MSDHIIAFTTDLAAGDDAALATAVALASRGGARLVTVHATSGAVPPAELMARAPALAASWSAPLDHREMVHACCDEVTDTLLDALRRVEASLVVASTHGRGPIAQLLAESVAEGVARNLAIPTLFVPRSGRGLADAGTGAIDLARIVVAAGDADATRAGLEGAALLASLAGARDVEVLLLHVDDGTEPPAPEPMPDALRITRRRVGGSLEAAIASVAQELHACAIVMATRGHDGVLDTIAGSHTERVLRRSECPVLSVPLAR